MKCDNLFNQPEMLPCGIPGQSRVPQQCKKREKLALNYTHWDIYTIRTKPRCLKIHGLPANYEFDITMSYI